MTSPPKRGALTRSQNRSRIAAALLLVGCAAIVVVAATRAGKETSGAPSSSSACAIEASNVAPGLSGFPPLKRRDGGVETEVDPLTHIHQALAALVNGSRHENVHVLFFGDSHAQGEMWTGGLRQKLQRRFGNGGPGFIYAGSPKHRNDAVHLETTGAFTIEPHQPSTTTRYADGKLGLGGVLSLPDRGTAHVQITPREESNRAMAWDVCSITKSAHDSLKASGDGLQTTAIQGVSEQLTHSVVRTAPPNRLTLDVDGTALCGVVGELEPNPPGVVVDAMGINGARYQTALAWDEQAFVSELHRRSPDLVIFEYGTNEEGDVPPRDSDVANDAAALVERARRAAPEASCLVLGATERNDRIDAAAGMRDTLSAAADRAGCAFWDTYQKMGGRGSMHAWQMAQPELAQRDGIHMTADGYAKLAEMLFDDMTQDLKPTAP